MSCSSCFLSYLQLCSIDVRDTKSADIRNLYIGGIYTKHDCSTRGTCIGGADIKDDFIRDICSRDASDIGMIKRLGIHLRLSQILELR